MPHFHQNCDATVRVISKAAVEELKTHIPQANATHLYLQVSLWIHQPFRNENFGSPPAVTEMFMGRSNDLAVMEEVC